MNTLQVLFTTILNMSITASIVAIGVIFARLILKKVPRIFSYALWSAVLIRLVFPVTFTSTFSLLSMIKPGTQKTSRVFAYVPYNMGLMQTPGIDVGVNSINKAVNSSLPQAVHTASVNPMQIIMAILNIVWVVGVALLILYSIISYLKVINNVKTATLVKDEIFETDRIVTPFVCGFIKPKIYIPTDISQSELSYILAHERVHIKRLDYLIKPFAFLVLSVHWFNPLMWLSFFLMSRDLEMSCDESVLKIFGDETRANYSQSLLALATGKRQLLSGSPLAFGESNAKARIKNILNYKKPACGVVVVALIATVAMLVLFSLVDNVQVINCDMLNSTDEDRTSFSTLSSTYTRERVEQLMGGDVRNYSSNSESLITLIDRVNSLWKVEANGTVLIDEQIEKYLVTIISSPQISSNPQDYIKAHEYEYNAILALDDKALPYLFSEFEKGGQNGLKGHIMVNLCRTILGSEDIKYANATPQDWYDTYKNHIKKMVEENGLEWVRSHSPTLLVFILPIFP